MIENDQGLSPLSNNVLSSTGKWQLDGEYADLDRTAGERKLQARRSAKAPQPVNTFLTVGDYCSRVAFTTAPVLLAVKS